MDFDQITIECDRERAFANSLRCREVRAVAEAVAKNADVLLRLLGLPLVVATVAVSETHRLAFHVEAMTRNKRFLRGDKSPEVRSAVEEDAKQLFEAAQKANPKMSAVSDAAVLLRRLQEQEGVKVSTRALMYAGATLAWTSLECAAKDAWVVALNLRPVPLGHSALLGVSPEASGEGIGAKQISVGFLAMHGFDLRDKLGSVLHGKFDFTGVDGIRAAYTSAFGKHAEIGSALASEKLVRLEAVRHLVAHRAGIVDQEYNRRMGEDLPLGTPLPLTGGVVSDLANAAIQASRDLLRFVDDWLSQAKSGI